MKCLKSLLTLWKYRKYDTIYYLYDTTRNDRVVVNIRLAKLLHTKNVWYEIMMLSGIIYTVHKYWIARSYKEAKQRRKEILNWEKQNYYE